MLMISALMAVVLLSAGGVENSFGHALVSEENRMAPKLNVD
jgi:hypothetical protein